MPRVKDLQRYRKIYSYYRPKPIEEAAAIGGVDETVIQGLDWKQSVIAASISNITASLPTEISPYFVGSPVTFTLDGVAIENEDRILIKDQTTPSQNGIYLYYSSSVAQTYWFTRALDAEQDTLTAAAAVFVEQGANNADSAFVLTTNDPITVGTTAQTWVKFAGAGSSIFNSSGSYGKTAYSVSFDSSSRYADAIGSDVFFFVSGSISPTANANKKVSLFGGDVVISGSISQGTGSVSSGVWSQARGNTAVASGHYSHAEGNATSATGAGSHAEGSETVASGDYSHAEGYGVVASGNYSHAEGASTLASAINSHAEGSSTTASGIASHAEGSLTTASGLYSHAEGTLTTASGVNSHAEGVSTKAHGDGSHAAGQGAETIGNYSYAGGNSTVASGTYQHVIGVYNARDNLDSLFVVGAGADDNNRKDILRVNMADVQVTGSLIATLGLSGSLTKLHDGASYIVAGSGIGVVSSSNGQVTISAVGAGVPGGSTTQIQYNDNGAFTGSVNFAYDGSAVYLTGSLSNGEGSAALGTYSHAEGYGCIANGAYSHAEGENTTAIGYASHAEGATTIAYGWYSHAAGANSKTIGDSSYAGGYDTVASGAYQHVIGKQNVLDNTESLFIVGNSDGMTRSDILRVNMTDVQVTGSFIATLGLSGSLTNLVDGTSYLVAGAGVTIVSASNGQVTISSLGEPGGSNTQIQYNNNGTFTGSINFTFDGSKVCLTGSLAHGISSDATGTRSHAEGEATIASGYASHSEGYYATASGNTSHAEGAYTVSSGDGSHAEGFQTIASALCSHSEGSGSIAAGSYSHAAGVVTIALETGSFAGGWGTIASGTYQHALGKYNSRNNDFSLFVVGDGTGNDDAQRGDIFRVNPGASVGSGKVEVTGSFAVSGSMLMSVISAPAVTTYAVNLGDHLVVFTNNVITATLPTSAEVGFNVVFKDGTGTASSSPQMLSCSLGQIDGAATYTLPAVNYSAVTVVKTSQPDTWVVI